MDLDKILNLALNKALIGKNRIKHINSNEIADFVNKHLEAINYTRCSLELCECKGSGGIRMDGTCGRCEKPLDIT
jgi:hypothetical protein